MGDYDAVPDTELTTMNRFLTLCVELTYDKLRSTTIEGVDLNTLSFVSGDNESIHSVAPGSAAVVGRSCHSKTTMFEANTHEADEADEATETDETRYTDVVTSLVTAWYHGKHGGHAMTTSNIGESTVKDTPNAEKTFFGGFEKPREKNFIFAVDANESVCPQPQNTPNRRNQAIEAFKAIQTNNFSNNNNHYYYYYWYHSVYNTYNDQPQKTSLVPAWYQREFVEVGA